MTFDLLTTKILDTHNSLQKSAIKAVNVHLTLRNWLIGYHIIEFEQNGEDRAKYGTKLLSLLAKDLKSKNLSKINERELRNFRTFYKTYIGLQNHISEFLIYQIATNRSLMPSIRGLITPELKNNEILDIQNTDNQLDINYFKQIFSSISYTHFVEIIKIKDSLKRRFYELLVIKSTLSVEELKRQIATLAYERVGLSQNNTLAFRELESRINPENTKNAVKSIYIFDFLDLPNGNLIEENELEEALMNHLTKFILELGNGFCFEARQKRLLIDNEYYFVDLVFYHRILKCHILIELKVDKFKHEHLSQLNSYVACFNDQIKQDDDNVTIGILLCTEKGEKMVEYALAGMEEKLFVSKYLLELPSKKTLEEFIENEVKR